jgi:hypothetical protein
MKHPVRMSELPKFVSKYLKSFFFHIPISSLWQSQEAAGAMVFALLRAADQAESSGKARYQSLARLYSR